MQDPHCARGNPFSLVWCLIYSSDPFAFTVLQTSLLWFWGRYPQCSIQDQTLLPLGTQTLLPGNMSPIWLHGANPTGPGPKAPPGNLL